MSRFSFLFGPLPILIMAVAVSSLPAQSAAQTVRGRILEVGTGNPVRGALVLLLDQTGATRSGFLSEEGGGYLLRTSRPGTYRVRVERIGYATITSSTFRMDRGEVREVDLSVSPAPLSLGDLEIIGDRRCLVRPEEGVEIARVWEEARKALANQDLTSSGGFLKYQVVRYKRELDRSGVPVEDKDREVASLVGQTPIRSMPAEDLVANGYIREVNEGVYDYFGPDARVLLSDPFLDTHCFRLVENRDHPERIGLAFQPVQRRRLPDIQGTIWLNRDGGALKLLEYSYTRAPWSEAQGVARGRVEFENLPTGAWVIRRWWIRMPLMVVDHAVRGLGGEGLRVAGILEEGGEVTKVSYLRGGRIVDQVTTQVEEVESSSQGER